MNLKSQLPRLAMVGALAAAGTVVTTVSPAMAAQVCSANGVYAIYCGVDNTDKARAKVPCYKITNDTLVQYNYGPTITKYWSIAPACPTGTEPGAVIVDYSV